MFAVDRRWCWPLRSILDDSEQYLRAREAEAMCDHVWIFEARTLSTQPVRRRCGMCGVYRMEPRCREPGIQTHGGPDQEKPSGLLFGRTKRPDLHRTARPRFSPLSAGSSVLDALWIVAIILEQPAYALIVPSRPIRFWLLILSLQVRFYLAPGRKCPD